MTEPSPTSTRASRGAGPGRPAEGRLHLLAAAEQLFATRGLGVPNREIVDAAGQHNRSAITYHFVSRAGLIDAVCEQHETPIAQHRQHLIARLPEPGHRTTRQLVEAHIQPLTAEMLRSAPSYWARLSEMLLVDQPLRFSRGIEPAVYAWPQQRADAVLSELLELMVAHLRHLPEPEAVGRVALTVRFASTGLARWERDSELGLDGVVPLAAFALMLTDLAVAMLDAPSSVLPQIAQAGLTCAAPQGMTPGCAAICQGDIDCVIDIALTTSIAQSMPSASALKSRSAPRATRNT